ncbi:MAG: dihydrodipicolinate synthase family protein [Candidatus Krumholzibacteriia bacterium]
MSQPVRAEILSTLLPDAVPPLWVPLLTYYRMAGHEPVVTVDDQQMMTHAHALHRTVPLWMVAGSTGDGWELNDAHYEQLLSLAASPRLRRGESRILMAALRPTTSEVVNLVERIHRVLGTSPGAGLASNIEALRSRGWVGICVCPPCGKDISQEGIARHLEAVFAATRMPVAVYQLPQVTGCRLEPDTFRELAERHPEIILFKDSSGDDDVAARMAEDEPAVADRPLLVRGAESNYAGALRSLGGPYDGLLLSTGNNFAPDLRRTVDDALAGNADAARDRSDRLEALVARLFAAAEGHDAPGNPFATVNRAVDHVRRHGSRWRDAPAPLVFDGSRLPAKLLEAVAAVLASTADDHPIEQ